MSLTNYLSSSSRSVTPIKSNGPDVYRACYHFSFTKKKKNLNIDVVSVLLVFIQNNNYNLNYNSMITRYCPRRYISRITHKICY